VNTNSNNINPFDKVSGSASLSSPKGLIVLFLTLLLIAVLIAKLKIVGIGLLFVLMFWFSICINCFQILFWDFIQQLVLTF